jgi:hypothetical protein
MAMLWRHGDVLIAAVPSIPRDARRRVTPILVRGEITGHSHRLAEPDTAELWERHGALFINVVAEAATVIHEEHRPITLPRGIYKVWQQREYTPRAIRTVID